MPARLWPLLWVLAQPQAEAARLLSVRSVSAVSDAGTRQALSALDAAEDADARELGAAFGAAERALRSARAALLEAAAAAPAPPAGKAAPPPPAKKNATHANAASEGKVSLAKKGNASLAKKAAEKAAAPPAEKAAANTPNSSHQNTTAMLGGQLSILLRAYDRLKKSIVRGNKHEQEGQKMDVENIAKMEAKVRSDEAALNSTNLSDFQREMLTNSTRLDKAELIFWRAHRKHAHGAFHAQLTMSHAMMQRLKGVTEIYQDVLKGKKLDVSKLQGLAKSLPPAHAAA